MSTLIALEMDDLGSAAFPCSVQLGVELLQDGGRGPPAGRSPPTVEAGKVIEALNFGIALFLGAATLRSLAISMVKAYFVTRSGLMIIVVATKIVCSSAAGRSGCRQKANPPALDLYVQSLGDFVRECLGLRSRRSCLP